MVPWCLNPKATELLYCLECMLADVVLVFAVLVEVLLAIAPAAVVPVDVDVVMASEPAAVVLVDVDVVAAP